MGGKGKNPPPLASGPWPRIRSCLEQGKATLASLPQAGDRGTDRGGAAPPLPTADNQAAGLTQRFDGVLGGLLLFGAAARHERGDGEGVGPGGQLWLGRRRELHGPQRAVLATDWACRTAVQLPQGRQKPTHSAKFPSAISAESGTPDESAPTSQELHTGLCPSPQSPPAPETSNQPERTGGDQQRAQPGARTLGRSAGPRAAPPEGGDEHRTRKAQGSCRTASASFLPPLAGNSRSSPSCKKVTTGGAPLRGSGRQGARAQACGARRGAEDTAPGRSQPCALICWRQLSRRPAASQRLSTSPLPDSAAGGGAVGWAGRARPGRGSRTASRRYWPRTWRPFGKSVTTTLPQMPLAWSPSPGAEGRACGRERVFLKRLGSGILGVARCGNLDQG